MQIILVYIQIREHFKTGRYFYNSCIYSGVWNMPIMFVSVVANDWLLPSWACEIAAFIDNTVLFASVWTVAVCSFDRFIAFYLFIR